MSCLKSIRNALSSFCAATDMQWGRWIISTVIPLLEAQPIDGVEIVWGGDCATATFLFADCS